MCGVLFHFSVRLSFLDQDATPWLLALSMNFVKFLCDADLKQYVGLSCH